MELFVILLFTLAVSADGFLVGLAYGIRNIKIPLPSLLLIALASATAVSVSMLFGKALAHLLDPSIASLVGCILLMLVGIYFLIGFCRERIQEMADTPGPLWELELKPLGLIVHILKEPQIADMDHSGEISLKEAVFLGVALAMDAFGAGAGMAMTGASILLSALCVGVLKFTVLSVGSRLGTRMRSDGMKKWLSLLSGLILCGLAWFELLS